MKKFDPELYVNQASENRIATIAALIVERGQIEGRSIRPHIAARATNRLVSLASSIHAHAVNSCNREVSAQEETRFENNREKFAKIAEYLGFSSRTGGDPRGACAYLIDPKNPTEGDGWGDGWAIFR